MRGLHRALIAAAATAAVMTGACLDAADPNHRLSEPDPLAPQDSVPPDSTVSDSTYAPPDSTANDSTYAPPDTATVPGGTLRLLEPEPAAWIPQNDSTLGCPAHQYRGYGFQLRFRWEAPDSAPAPAAYHLYVKKETALYPIVDVWLPAAEYHMVACNSFVIDRNLGGWYWNVEAVDASWTVIARSEARWFAFLTCRLANGQACSAPGAPAMAEGTDRPRTGVESPPDR